MPSFPITILPGESVQIPISFTPTLAGARDGTAIIYHNADGSTTVVNLDGTGVAIPPGPPGSSVGYYCSFGQAFTQNVAMTMPSGGAGDLLVAVIAGKGSTAFTAPGGWTVIEAFYGDTVNDPYLLVAYKIRGASEPTATFTRGVTDDAAWTLMNFVTAGRPAPYTYDTSVGYSSGSPDTYHVPAIVTTKPDTLLILASIAPAFDTNLYPASGPSGPGSLLPSPGFVPSGPSTFGVFDYAAWGGTFAAYNTGVPYIMRVFAGFWSGEGYTGEVSYGSPAGNVENRTFLVAFREAP